MRWQIGFKATGTKGTSKATVTSLSKEIQLCNPPPGKQVQTLVLSYGCGLSSISLTLVPAAAASVSSSLDWASQRYILSEDWLLSSCPDS